MARRTRKANVPEEAKKELEPSKSPVFFLAVWLLVPMITMIGYAVWLRGG